jgi:CRISPR-associated protein Cas2
MAGDVITVVMSYDIEDDRTRRRVADILEDRMARVQKSVFEARLYERAAVALFEQVRVELGPGDSLRMYVLSKTGLEKSRVAGGAPLPEEGAFWLL